MDNDLNRHFDGGAKSTQRRRGWLERLPAGWKLAGVLSLLLTVVVLKPDCTAGLWIVTGVILALFISARIPLKAALKRLLLLEPLVLSVAALMWFQPGGGTLFLVVMIKTHLCLLTTLLLAQTTPFSELIRVLQRLHVPWIFVTTFTLMHRYIDVLSGEAERMKRARTSRTFTSGQQFQWRTLSTVVGQLFVRTSERAGRIYNAMCARGWK